MNNKGKTLPPEPLTPSEVARLMRLCNRRCPTGLRNRALIALLWRCGLRISEALSLHPKDVDAARGTVRVLRGKGRKHRVVGIDPGALEIVAEWVTRRAELGFGGRERLFCTLDGRPVQPQYIRNLMRRLGRKAGIEKRVHAHGLRHTHASELRQEGVEIGIISKQLGHSSIATTALYLDHVCPETVVETIRARTWG
ncbi:MAG TPA: site-specific integrase [Anaerolineae bacterium]|nr:site-specific integrase [Anaerolineae bacterium]